VMFEETMFINTNHDSIADPLDELECLRKTTAESVALQYFSLDRIEVLTLNLVLGQHK